MEYKIDEIFELNGNKYQMIEDNGFFCDNCCFDNSKCMRLLIDSCTRYFRKDRKDVIFKLIEE